MKNRLVSVTGFGMMSDSLVDVMLKMIWFQSLQMIRPDELYDHIAIA